MHIPNHIIDNFIFKIPDERLERLARLFDYHKLNEKLGMRFCDFVYKYERGIYESEFPYPGREATKL